MGLTYRDLSLSAFESERSVAVGVSGGPDSIALAWILKDWAAAHGIALHLLTVDHGLREESAAEAKQAAKLVKDWPNTTHAILNWAGEKPGSRVLEEARRARYELLADYCAQHDIRHLFLAHHQDDQAETFLFRLAKGSGLDGLAGMQASQAYSDHLTLVRPLLAVPKQDLIDLCRAHHLDYLNDPTNENANYTRPRLRAARAALEEEGLSAKRLATTAQRMARARAALEQIAGEQFDAALLDQSQTHVALDWKKLSRAPQDIIVRVLMKIITQVSALEKDYPPRLEKIEEVAGALAGAEKPCKTTLAGCLIALDPSKAVLSVKQESA